MMAGLIYIEKVDWEGVEATSDGLTLRLLSDGDRFGFRFSHHAAVSLVEALKNKSWPLHCAPDGDLISLKKERAKRTKKV